MDFGFDNFDNLFGNTTEDLQKEESLTSVEIEHGYCPVNVVTIRLIKDYDTSPIIKDVNMLNTNSWKLPNPTIIALQAFINDSIYGKPYVETFIYHPHELPLDIQGHYKSLISRLSLYPDRRHRINEIQESNVYKSRLINEFIVSYVRKFEHVEYYLDTRTFPHKIAGTFNDKSSHLGLEGFVWMNVNTEYTNLYKPTSWNYNVKGDDGVVINMGKLNFLLWLDDYGIYEACLKLKNSILKFVSTEKTKRKKEVIASEKMGVKVKRLKKLSRSSDIVQENYQPTVTVGKSLFKVNILEDSSEDDGEDDNIPVEVMLERFLFQNKHKA